MLEYLTSARWTRHLVYRSQRTRTTLKLRLGVLVLVVGVLWPTSGWWTAAIARSLVCEGSLAPSDAILIENFNANYPLFERAARLRKAGFAGRVLVPIRTNEGSQQPDEVALGIVQVMARVAGTGTIEAVPTQEAEPVSLNVARDVQRFVAREHIRSVVVVTPLFRSRRSAMVYGTTVGHAGVTIRCQPVEGSIGVKSWTRSWHGIQDVCEQWLKLQYYRLYVLPFRSMAQKSRPGTSTDSEMGSYWSPTTTPSQAQSGDRRTRVFNLARRRPLGRDTNGASTIASREPPRPKFNVVIEASYKAWGQK